MKKLIVSISITLVIFSTLYFLIEENYIQLKSSRFKDIIGKNIESEYVELTNVLSLGFQRYINITNQKLDHLLEGADLSSLGKRRIDKKSVSILKEFKDSDPYCQRVRIINQNLEIVFSTADTDILKTELNQELYGDIFTESPTGITAPIIDPLDETIIFYKNYDVDKVRRFAVLFYYTQDSLDSIFKRVETLEYESFLITTDKIILINFPEIDVSDQENLSNLIQLISENETGVVRVILGDHDKTVYYQALPSASIDWTIGLTLDTERLRISKIGTLILVTQALVVLSVLIFVFISLRRKREMLQQQVGPAGAQVPGATGAAQATGTVPGGGPGAGGELSTLGTGVVSLKDVEEVTQVEDLGEAEVAEEAVDEDEEEYLSETKIEGGEESYVEESYAVEEEIVSEEIEEEAEALEEDEEAEALEEEEVEALEEDEEAEALEEEEEAEALEEEEEAEALEEEEEIEALEEEEEEVEALEEEEEVEALEEEEEVEALEEEEEVEALEDEEEVEALGEAPEVEEASSETEMISILEPVEDDIGGLLDVERGIASLPELKKLVEAGGQTETKRKEKEITTVQTQKQVSGEKTISTEEEEYKGAAVYEEERPLTIPEQVFREREGIRHDDELSHLIDRIDEKVGQLLDIRRIGSVYNDFIMHLGVSTGAVLFKNQEGSYSPFVSSGLTSQTDKMLQFKEGDKILTQLLRRGKTLYIKENPFMSRELKNKFEPVDSSKIKELFLTPVFKENNLVCIVTICITLGEMFDSNLIIKEIRKLIKAITKII
jgi:hypothetical protein